MTTPPGDHVPPRDRFPVQMPVVTERERSVFWQEAAEVLAKGSDALRAQLTAGPFVRGARVRKTKGFRYPGIVAGCVQNQAGEWRVVVEAEHEDFKGMLHIYHPDQLEIRQ